MAPVLVAIAGFLWWLARFLTRTVLIHRQEVTAVRSSEMARTAAMLAKLAKMCYWRIGSVQTDANHQVPEYIVVLNPPMLVVSSAKMMGMEVDRVLTCVIYRPWFVPEFEQDGNKVQGSAKLIKTFTNVNKDPSKDTDLRPTLQQVCSKNVPCDAKDRATLAAEAIVSRFRTGNRAGCVFVIHGEPGSGKSLTGRFGGALRVTAARATVARGRGVGHVPCASPRRKTPRASFLRRRAGTTAPWRRSAGRPQSPRTTMPRPIPSCRSGRTGATSSTRKSCSRTFGAAS